MGFLKQEIIGIKYKRSETRLFKNVWEKYTIFNSSLLGDQRKIKKDLLNYMFSFVVYLRFFQVPMYNADDTYLYVMNRINEMQKFVHIDQILSTSGGKLPNGNAWNYNYPTDTHTLAHIFNWQLTKEHVDYEYYDLEPPFNVWPI